MLSEIEKFQNEIGKTLSESNNVQYEVYCSGGSNQTDSSVALQRLEQRIFQLEKLLGCPNPEDSYAENFVDTLEKVGPRRIEAYSQLERRVDLLDEKKLEEISARVALLNKEMQSLQRLSVCYCSLVRFDVQESASPEEDDKVTKLLSQLEVCSTLCR